MAYHSLLRRKINSTLGQATSHQFQLPTFILAREFLFFIFFLGGIPNLDGDILIHVSSPLYSSLLAFST